MKTETGMIAWFARNPVAANLLMAMIILSGIISLTEIRRQVFPDIDINVISIQVPYPGAAPQEVEEGINLKIEQAIENINGIKKTTSVAGEGFASVSIEVEDGVDVLEVLDEVKIQTDAISGFPEDAEKPVIYRIKPTHDVIWLALYGKLTEFEMKSLANDIRDELVLIDGISEARVIGERDYEIAIEVSELRLREYGLTLDEVVAAVRNTSIDLPGGAIRSEAGNILLRTKGQAYYGEEFESIVIRTQPDGSRLLLGQIASVIDGFEEGENFASFDRQPSISIEVRAVGDQNELEIGRKVKAFAEQKRQMLPDGVYIADWADSSFYLQDRLDLMKRNMLAGALLVFLILALFLRLSLAFWVMLGLPICFLGALMLMPVYPFSLTINMISLFGFILVLGIVVDDAIIIGESVWSEVEKEGHSVENIIRGVKKVAMPATFGVLTTIVAFAPMLTVGGPFGVIWKTIGMVVILCLIFSLIESKFILPAHLKHMSTAPINPQQRNILLRGLYRIQNRFSSGLVSFANGSYKRALESCIHYRYITLACFIGGLLVAATLLSAGFVRWQFFPNIPSDFIQGSIEMVEGMPEKSRNQALLELESSLYRMNEALQAESGEGVIKHSMAWVDGDKGEIWAELSKGETREIDGFELANRWREATPSILGAKHISFEGSTNKGAGADLQFQLSGKSIEQLRAASSYLKAKVADYEGVFDVKDNLSSGKQEIKLRIKPEAQSLGLTLADLARQVRYSFYGAEVQRIQRDSEEIRVMVRYPESQRKSVHYLQQMRIRMLNGNEVPFYTVAEAELGDGYAQITRVDGVRSVDVEAKVDDEIVESDKIAKEIEEKVIPEVLRRFPEIKYELEGASKEERSALKSLQQAFAIALVVIFALMAIPLKSYLQPLIVMFVIPFGFIGAIVGHWLLGLPISVLSLCGIIALAGVVVNDSLIMVDFVNRARAEGDSLLDAAINAGTKRFRAIVLTSLTTFFGLTPILLEKSLQAQIVIPMAVSLAFGILFATVMTLFMVPCLYLILDDLKKAIGKLGAYLRYLVSH